MLDQTVQPDPRATSPTPAPPGYLVYQISPVMQEMNTALLIHRHHPVPDPDPVHHDHRRGHGHARRLVRGRHAGPVVDSVAAP